MFNDDDIEDFEAAGFPYDEDFDDGYQSDDDDFDDFDDDYDDEDFDDFDNGFPEEEDEYDEPFDDQEAESGYDNRRRNFEEEIYQRKGKKRNSYDFDSEYDDDGFMDSEDDDSDEED